METVKFEKYDFTVNENKGTFFQDRRNRFFGEMIVDVKTNDGCTCYASAQVVPSHRTEVSVCRRGHIQQFDLTGKVIRTSRGYLLPADVRPCYVCPNLDQWDKRIRLWAEANPEAYKKSVLKDRDCLSWEHPAEWALQEGHCVRPTRFPWDIEEMKEFLNRKRDVPPPSNFEAMIEKEKASGGDARAVVSEMVKLSTRELD